jgi:hypothetical protein
MFNYRHMNNIEARIISLRLELIRVVAAIRTVLKADRSAIGKPEYSNLKLKYSDIRGQIDALKAYKENLKA